MSRQKLLMHGVLPAILICHEVIVITISKWELFQSVGISVNKRLDRVNLFRFKLLGAWPDRLRDWMGMKWLLFLLGILSLFSVVVSFCRISKSRLFCSLSDVVFQIFYHTVRWVELAPCLGDPVPEITKLGSHWLIVRVLDHDLSHHLFWGTHILHDGLLIGFFRVNTSGNKLTLVIFDHFPVYFARISGPHMLKFQAFLSLGNF